MANQVYKGHTLISTCTFDGDTERWVPHVSVAWSDRQGNFHFHRFDGTHNIFQTPEDAVSHGLALGRVWVNKKL
jgi:hypothetical protein